MESGKELRAILSIYEEMVSALEAELSECAGLQIVALRQQAQIPLKELLKEQPEIFARGRYMHHLIQLRAELRKIKKLFGG